METRRKEIVATIRKEKEPTKNIEENEDLNKGDPLRDWAPRRLPLRNRRAMLMDSMSKTEGFILESVALEEAEAAKMVPCLDPPSTLLDPLSQVNGSSLHS